MQERGTFAGVYAAAVTLDEPDAHQAMTILERCWSATEKFPVPTNRPSPPEDTMAPHGDISARRDRCAAMLEKEPVYFNDVCCFTSDGPVQAVEATARGCFRQGSAALETPFYYTSDRRQQIISWFFTMVDHFGEFEWH